MPSTAYLADAIAVTLIILPARPPLVEPFNVITSLDAPEIKVLPKGYDTSPSEKPVNLHSNRNGVSLKNDGYNVRAAGASASLNFGLATGVRLDCLNVVVGR